MRDTRFDFNRNTIKSTVTIIIIIVVIIIIVIVIIVVSVYKLGVGGIKEVGMVFGYDKWRLVD